MRTEDEVRAERDRLMLRSKDYADQRRSDMAADFESDAQMLDWVLGEGEGRS